MGKDMTFRRAAALCAAFFLAACGTSTTKADGRADTGADPGDGGGDAAADDTLPGDFACLPGAVACEDAATYRVCLSDGSGWGDWVTCDTGAGERCYEGAGCFTPCSLAETHRTSMGCRFYAVDLDQSDGFGWNADNSVFAVVVANADDTFSANVLFEQRVAGSWQVMETFTLPAEMLYVYRLPADRHLENTGRDAGTSIRVTSDLPLIAYQFNPIDSANTFTNDASLLLPVATLGPSYRVATYQSIIGPDHYSYLAIVGTADGTSVTVTPSTGTLAGDGVEAIGAGASRTFTVGEGELLQIAADRPGADLTGSLVEATHPIALFAGTECSDIPQQCAWCRDSYGTTPGYPPNPSSWSCEAERCPAHLENTCAWCDHIEEQVFPLTTWGKRYIASRVPVRATGGVEAALWRVVASEPNTSVTITAPAGVELRFPPGTAGPPYVLDEGEYLEFEMAGTAASPGDALVEADMPVLLVQYVEGQECTDTPLEAGGDPAMVQMVPVEQYMDEYIFLTPSTYDADYLVVTRPAGAEVLLDGLPLAASLFRPAGGGFEVGTVTLVDGVHRIRGAAPFGIVVVGYSPYVSYAYVGGMDLEIINPII